ncbi:MAG TPA: tRNA (adenosine(37)-N6)-threonylcarbamoyltransferase complex ATPase subunit type 1 TsaE [Alphaproteobacteria bacterium]|nr:tRNA (adenosine(37)-N6)-threonylcarbamoyltransferase complex ATPase subunit type 1 TsaE [Alphaproteobacteria bacterium]
MGHIHHTDSEDASAALGAGIAQTLRRGSVLCLHGTLGMGKSVLARAIIRALAGNQTLDVPSPTYTLLQLYETPVAPIFHFDLYRLSAPEEIYELGWEDALAEGITIIEWPERLGHLAPPARTDITLTPGNNGPDSRVIEVSSP